MKIQTCFFIWIILLPGILEMNAQISADDRVRSSHPRLNNFFEQMHRAQSGEKMEQYADSVVHYLDSFLLFRKSFFDPFDQIRMGKVYAPDSLLRVYSWNIHLGDGHYRNFGFLQRLDTARGEIDLYRLEDREASYSNLEDTIVSDSNWYGALYYEVVVNEYMNKKYYTLLGIDFNDLFVQKKIIDALHFKDGQPLFGKRVFQDEDEGFKKRVVFQFNAQITMTLKYDHELGMIVFDHLSPSDPSYDGYYEYYGPDGSYDAYEYRMGYWYRKDDISLDKQ